MEVKNPEPDKSQDDAGPEQPPPQSIARELAKKVWSFITLSRVVLAFLLLSGLGILLNVFSLRDRINDLLTERRVEKQCRSYAAIARDYARKDDFDQSLRVLNLPDVAKECEGKTYIRILREEVDLFKLVNQQGPFQLKEDNNKVKVLEAGLKIFKDQAEASESPEFYTLFGILKDLSDWPGDAPKQFALAGNHPPAQNAWGLMILRWRIGGPEWSTQALSKFEQAGKGNPTYAWPHANKAAVLLELAQDEVNKNQPYNVETEKGEPNLDVAQTYLNNAKQSLELAGEILKNEEVRSRRADRSLQDHPRVHILWAQYYLVQGQVYRAQKGGGPETENYFRKAIDHLRIAKSVEPSVAEASLLLGHTYDELGTSPGQTGNAHELAIQEYQNAVSIDKNNLSAHMSLAYALFSTQSDSETRAAAVREVEFDLDLLDKVRQQFIKRRSNTGDPFAIAWLEKRLKELAIWEDNFKNMEKELKLRR